MICTNCNSVFDASEAIVLKERHPYQDGYAEEEVGTACPFCGSDNSLEDDKACECCLTLHGESQLEEGICKDCVTDLLKYLKAVWDEMSEPQQNWLKEHFEWSDEVEERVNAYGNA